MVYCILSKFLASLVALIVCILWPDLNIYSQAFLIGILPIWAEVLTSQRLKVEPAYEHRFLVRSIDNLVDLICFILIPPLWFYAKVSIVDTQAIMLFMILGTGRLVYFVKKGLDPDGYFIGLPVTYTGYIWVVLVGVAALNLELLVNGIIILFAILMVSPFIRIKPSIKKGDTEDPDKLKNKPSEPS